MRAFLTKKSVEQTIKPSRRNIWHFPSVTILFQKLALDFLCPFERFKLNLMLKMNCPTSNQRSIMSIPIGLLEKIVKIINESAINWWKFEVPSWSKSISSTIGSWKKVSLMIIHGVSEAFHYALNNTVIPLYSP